MILSFKNEEDVTDTNLKKLDKLVSNNNTILLNHATWCAHCHHFQPEWKKFKSLAAKNKVNVIDVESSALQKIEQNSKLYKKITPKDGMVYFPMIIIFVKKNKGTIKTFYKGNKTATELSTFIDKKFKATPAPAAATEEPKSPYPSPKRGRATSPRPRADAAASPKPRAASPSPKPRATSPRPRRAASPKPRAASPRPRRAASPPKPRAASPPKPRAASPPKVEKHVEVAQQDDKNDVFFSLQELNRQLDEYISKYG
jgi:thiol-disulfide isomerase/thioredoxin